MQNFNECEIVDDLIDQYGLSSSDNKRTVFAKAYEYFYDYFRSVQEECVSLAMESANTTASDSEQFNKIYNEIQERNYGS